MQRRAGLQPMVRCPQRWHQPASVGKATLSGSGREVAGFLRGGRKVQVCTEPRRPPSPGCRLRTQAGSEPASSHRGCMSWDRSLNLSVSRHHFGLVCEDSMECDEVGMEGQRRGDERGAHPSPAGRCVQQGRAPPECLHLRITHSSSHPAPPHQAPVGQPHPSGTPMAEAP